MRYKTVEVLMYGASLIGAKVHDSLLGMELDLSAEDVKKLIDTESIDGIVKGSANNTLPDTRVLVNDIKSE